MTGGGGDQRRTLRNFVTPGVQGIASTTAHPNVDANNFELKAALISMVQLSQFGCTPLKDPNLHLLVFLKVCDKLKFNGVYTDAIRLRLFLFSLRDKVRACLHSFPSGCINKSFPHQVFPSKQNGKCGESNHQLHSKRWKHALWSLGVD